MKRSTPNLKWMAAGLLVTCLLGCGAPLPDPRDAGHGDAGPSDGGLDGGVSPDQPDAGARRPLSLSDLLAEVTPADLESVEQEWAARDHAARDVTVAASGSLTLGTVPTRYRVLAHTVDGERHYGVVLVPDALSVSTPAPVLIYAHGGYTGDGGLAPFSAEELGFRVPGQPLREKLIYVIPSYRGERVEVAGVTYESEGTTLLGLTDLSDTASLLTAVLATTPEADPDRVAILGESRGGMVALALGARDPRIDLVVDAFGPTDFRLSLSGLDEPFFQAVLGAAVADPANLNFLELRSLVPLEEVTPDGDGGHLITEGGYLELRRRMAATSALANAGLLPALQVHHGTADMTAPVAHSRALSAAMSDAGRPSGGPSFTYFEYDGGGHSLGSLPGSVGRIADVISAELQP